MSDILYDKVYNYLHTTFITYVKQSTNDIDWYWKLLEDNKIVYLLINHLNEKNDLFYYIQIYLNKLVYGLKCKLVDDLIDINNNSIKTIHICETIRKPDIIEAWRSGKLTPINLFSDLFYSIKSNTIDKIIGNKVTNYVLNEGGYNKFHYINSNPNIMKLRKKIDILNIQLVDILDIYSSYKNSESVISIETSSQIYNIYNNASNFNYSIQRYNNILRHSITNNHIHYQHIGNFNGIHIVNSKSIIRPNVPTPVVLIGESIKLNKCNLEIHEVICIDSIDLSIQSNWITMNILVKGFDGLIDQESLYDSMTDVGENAVDENLNSSNGSNEEYLDNTIQLPAIVPLKPKYYIIVVNVIELSTVVIQSVIPLVSFTLIDQTPTTIRIINSDGDCVIYGSNGLLIVVKPHSYLQINQTNVILDSDDCYIDDLSNGIRCQISSMTSLSINESSIHSIDSNITAVSFKKNLLVSCDNNGMICLWSINQFESCNCLLNSIRPFNKRITNAVISSTANHIIICYTDRCVVINITTDGSTYAMFVKSILDIVNGYRAIYHPIFEDNGIVIYRFMNGHSSKRRRPKSFIFNVLPLDIDSEFIYPGVIVTSWTHLNIDSFDIQSIDKQFNNDINLSRTPDNITPSIVRQNLSPAFNLETPISPYEFTERESTPYKREIETSNEDASDKSFVVSYYLSNNHIDNDVDSNIDSKVDHEIYIDKSINNQLVDINRHQQLSYDMSTNYCPTYNSTNYDLKSEYMKFMTSHFIDDMNDNFLLVKPVIAVYAAISTYQTTTLGLVAAALDKEPSVIIDMFDNLAIKLIFNIINDYVYINDQYHNIIFWLTSKESNRIGKEFWIDISIGHNYMCALHLKYCANKSVAVESPWQDYLRNYGPMHLRNSSRKLKELTINIRKLDETSGIKDTLPGQLGYISGLQEIYARRVGLYGKIPEELGELSNLRVLSMGNNRLCGELPKSLGKLQKLQRIVLHQNCLTGIVPKELGKLGCIVNLAGNTGLEHGEDVPNDEREALVDIYLLTSGYNWFNKMHWLTSEPVSKWYKVGVLTSHVHSIVMSSNGMSGKLPPSISKLKELRMIELATMTELVGPLPKELFSITTLRRLCICRCGLTGSLPEEIGQLVTLEELQLFGNHLSGDIPNSLGNLKGLKLLSLGEYTGGNDFNKSSLPSCLSKLTSLEALFMANCNLTGTIPSWISELTELRQLDLQRNFLNGSLPNSIGRLTNLLYLNLKDNEQLSGKLPITSMTALNRLNRLSLVHCNFEDAERSVVILQTHLPRCKIWI